MDFIRRFYSEYATKIKQKKEISIPVIYWRYKRWWCPRNDKYNGEGGWRDFQTVEAWSTEVLSRCRRMRWGGVIIWWCARPGTALVGTHPGTDLRVGKLVLRVIKRYWWDWNRQTHRVRCVFKLLILYWRTVDLQPCVSFSCTSMWPSFIYIFYV